MATAILKTANNTESKVTPKGNVSSTVSPIRVSQKTKTKLDQLQARANKGRVARKIKACDLIAFSLDLMTDEHLSEICNKSLSNKDRIELLFAKLLKERRCANRDEFFGLLLEGKIAI